MFATFDNKPINSKPNTLKHNNNYYVGHIYSTFSTIPTDYLFWYSPPKNKSLTITGESKAQILRLFKKSLLNSNLESACKFGIELHCSNYLKEVFNILIEVYGNYIHIHNPQIGSQLINCYLKYEKQIVFPDDSGSIKYPEDDDFFLREDVQKLNSTLNCQPIRNFVIELITIICLSHQKEMKLPIISKKDLTPEYLYKAARLLKIGGTNLHKVVKKEPLKIILKVIEKNILFKTPKIDKAIYWILWISRGNHDFKCKHLSIDDIPKKESNHWVWYVWKSIFKRVKYLEPPRRETIKELYNLFKVNFTKKIVKSRLPLVFFAIRSLEFNMRNQPVSILNNLHLHIQAYSNVNVLYKNLQIRLMRKSWIDVVGEKVKQKRISKVKKEIKKEKEYSSIQNKMAYLDIIPKANTHF